MLALLLSCLAAPPPPAILLITLDTTRADRLGPYGYPLAQTPAWDRLAAEGTTFLRAYSTCPLTIPSHSTILTGRPPPDHGVRDNGDFILSDEATLITELLQPAGYTTAAFTAAFPTQRRWGFNQGFDHYSDPLSRQPTRLDWSDERPADQVVDDAIATLTSLHVPGTPQFAWVHLFDAHWPYAPPEPYKTSHAARPYDGEIAFTDEQAGRLLQWWDATHPRSVVVVTADHGEGMGDGGEMTHGFLLHDGTIRVPLIVRLRGMTDPGLPAGGRPADPVSHTDIVPTLLGLAGLAPGADVVGRDLRAGGSERPYSEAMTGQFNLGLAPLHAFTDAYGRYTEGAWGARYPASGERVLTLAGPRPNPPGDAQTLAGLRDDFDTPEATQTGVDPHTLAMLEALGYIGGDVQAPAGDIDPRDVIDLVPLTWRARQAIGKRRLDEAEQMIARLEDRLPETFGVQLLRAQLLRARGERFEALQRFVDLFRRAPSSMLALHVAQIYTTRGDMAAAEDWYTQALDLQPASPEAMAGRVHSVLAQGQPELAAELADRYLAAYPDHADLLLVQAELLAADGRLDAALEQARVALGAVPYQPRAHVVTATILWELGRPEEAIERLTDALVLDPFDVRVVAQRTRCLLEVGRNAEAVRTIRPAAAGLPNDAIVQELAEQAWAALETERGAPLPR